MIRDRLAISRIMTHISLPNTRGSHTLYSVMLTLCIAMATANDGDFLGSLDISSLNERSSSPTAFDVQIQCHASSMCIRLSKDWLMNQWGVSELQQLSLRQRCDSNAEEDESHFVLCTNGEKMTSCGSQLSQNDTHASFSNNVLILLIGRDSNSVRFVPAVKASLPWKCTYPIQLLVGVDFVPQISPVTVFLGNKTGYGRFEAAMFLYKDENFETTYDTTPQLKISDRLRVKVQLLRGPDVSRVQIVKCWGTPVQYPDEDELTYTLIDNFCPSTTATSADVALRNNGDLHHASWEANVFRFVVSPEVYLHCMVRVCFEGEACLKNCTPQMETDKAMSRNRREIGTGSDTGILSLGPLRVAKEVPQVMEEALVGKSTEAAVESPQDVRENMILGMPRLAVFAMLGGLLCVSLVLIVGVFAAIYKKMVRRKREKTEAEWQRKAEARNTLSARFTLSDSPPFEIPISVPNTIANLDESGGR